MDRQEIDYRQFRMKAICIFLLASTFYLYEFILQVSLGVMSADIMRGFAINASGLGLMFAFYFYSYTIMQVPAGMLFDRYGPRKLISFAILIVAAGTFFFSTTTYFSAAAIARLLMGVGSAFSFIGSLILIAYWFEARYFALLAGITQLMSSVGAFIGGAPLASLIQRVGWRESMYSLALIGIVLAVITYLIVRDRPALLASHSPSSASSGVITPITQQLKHVGKNPQTWFVGLYAFAIWAPIPVFAESWGTAYIEQFYELSVVNAAFYISLIWLGIAAACPFFGWLSDKIGRRNLPMQLCAIIGFISSVIAIYTHLSLWLLAVMLISVGVSAAGQNVSFAVVKENNVLSDMGTAYGLNNMATVAGGAVFNPLVGCLLSYLWIGKIENAVPVYGVFENQMALSVIPLCYILALILSTFFIKETYCEQQV